LTAFGWGTLPIALKGLLAATDPFTITWFRFVISALLLGCLRPLDFLAAIRLRGSSLLLLAAAAGGLGGSYIMYILALGLLTPSTTQIVIQLSPTCVLFGSLLIFKEPFGNRRRFGFLVLAIGMALFFNRRFDELLGGVNDLTTGILLLVGAALGFSLFALCQKQLLGAVSSTAIMFPLFLAGSLFFAPVAQPSQLLELQGPHTALLASCAASTLISFMAYSTAMRHLETSRVSVVTATAPLFTILGMALAAPLAPDLFAAEALNTLSLVGAAMVVIGSMLSSMGSSR
jgi:drug/metabolite transporter (DMT)-like permease